MLGLLRSYLDGRTAELCGNYIKVTKEATKGCPQGPDLWNMVLDGLLRILEERGCSFAAYVDDLIVIISSNTRRGIEQAEQDVCRIIAQWFTENHLPLLPTKTEMVALRGKFRGRPPIIRLEGEDMQMVRVAKYLGIHISYDFNMGEHFLRVREKCKTTFALFSKLARASWGLKFPMMKLYYDSIFISIIA